MGKFKKSKKPFQGMEHLIKSQEIHEIHEIPKESAPLSLKLNENLENFENSSAHTNSEGKEILKKELISVLILMSVLFLVLVGLLAYDVKYDGLSVITRNITEFLNK